jgi:hypothetical protein
LHVDVVGAVLTSMALIVTLWLYPHCVRPALACASAPPRAFDVAILAMMGCTVVFGILLVDAFADQIHGWALLALSGITAILYATLAIGFFRPKWLARVGPRPDPTAHVRLVLSWLARQWTKATADPECRGLVRNVGAEIEAIREPANARIVDEWLQSFAVYLRQTNVGNVSARRAREQLEARLAMIQPIDRLARWF